MPSKKTAKTEPEPVVETKERRKAVPVTLENFQELADEIVATLDAEIDRVRSEKGKGVKTLKNVRKNVLLLRNRAPKLAKKKRRAPNANTKSGLLKEVPISDELAKFLKVKKGTSLSRIDVGRALAVYVNLKDGEKREGHLRWKQLNENGRNLRDKDKNSVINPDAALKKLLRYDQYVKDVKAGKVTQKRKNPDTGVIETVVVNDPTLYDFTITKLMRDHFVKA